jgi:MFS family permease
VNVLATGLSIYLIERTGRRPLLLLSTGGMMLSCIGLTFALQSNLPSSSGADPPAWVGMLSIGMVLVFVAFFEIGLGPIPWLIGAEIYPRAVRTQAMGVSSMINWLSNFAVGLSFPTMALWLGPMAFVPFAVVLAIALVLEWIYVPETQGKSLEEIQEEFLEADRGDEEDRPPAASSSSSKSLNGGSTKPASASATAPHQPAPTTQRRPSHRGDEEQATPIPEGKEDEDAGFLYPSDDDVHDHVDEEADDDSHGGDAADSLNSSSAGFQDDEEARYEER